MAVDAYADALVHLTAHRHGYVTLDIPVLLSTFERDSGNEFLRLQALCAYVGNKNAESFSHIRLAAGFINQIWANGPPHDFRVNKATNLVFRALLFRHRGREWANWAALLCEILTKGPRASLIHWCCGHFLPLGDLEEAVRKIRDNVPEGK